MNILITSGGTTEKIDEVRSITNMGTGTLGAMIADQFMAENAENEIIYVCSRNAVTPSAKFQTFIADDAAALEWTLREICSTHRIDVVIHAMAVSDYKSKLVTDASALAKSIADEVQLMGPELPGGMDDVKAEDFEKLLLNAPRVNAEGKIRSDHDNLVVILEKTPKIISMLRGLLPDAILVGFKLLVDAKRNELINAGYSLLKTNKCDFVFANDFRTVAAGKHAGYLIDREGSLQAAEGKEAIAELVVKAVISGAL